MRLPSIATFPLRRAADAASATSVFLARTAGILRLLAGQHGQSVPVERPSSSSAPAPSSRPASSGSATSSPAPGGDDKPVRSDADDRTTGRTAGERREPTPQPARGASAAQAKARRTPSTPKEARKTRARTTRAASLTTVETGASSGRGGTPSSGNAENSPKERAAAGAGRQPAPMGSEDDSQS